MARKPRHVPLRVLLNNQLVGLLSKELGGAISFRYEETWLAGGDAVPVSLSLPLREEPYKGEPVVAVFENLLPDSDSLRRKVATKVGADGIDAYSLLYRIGRDCVGALQFVPEDDDQVYDSLKVEGAEISEPEIEALLKNLAQAPLGLEQKDAFRISVAGAQEKTALLYRNGKWLKPHGTTPTSHILKTSIGQLPNGLDLSQSVENEHYCLALLAAFHLPVCAAEIHTFGSTQALVIERFDRRTGAGGQLLRTHQEDCCQALSVVPTRKYQSDGGPGMAEILGMLSGSDTPRKDQKTLLKAQILFWLIGATDGHAKNFSIFLGPGGSFHLTPLYDVLTAQPSLHAHKIIRQQMKLAMSVGSGHYRLDTIRGRHFVQTAERAGLPGELAREALDEIRRDALDAMDRLEQSLPTGPTEEIHEIVRKGMEDRLGCLEE